MHVETRPTPRRMAMAIAVLALSLIAAACGGDDDSLSAGSTDSDVTSEAASGDDEGHQEGVVDDAPADDDVVDSPSGEPIRVGVNIETSGPAAVIGTAHENSVTLLAELINDNGGVLGRPLELVILDNETAGETALLNTAELNDHGIVAMVGPGTSPTTMGALSAILESGLPTISMGSAGAIVVDPESGDTRSNVFKTAQNGSLMAEGIAQHILDSGLSKVGLLYVNNAYGEDGLNSWNALADDGAIELVAIEAFEAADLDMTVQLSSIVDSGAEAIVVWSIPPGAPTVRRNAVENLGINLPMYHDGGAGAEIYLDLAGDAAEGVFMIHPKTLVWDLIAETDPQAGALSEFGTAYVDRYGAMSGFAGYSWDALGMIVAAMEDAGSTEPDAIVAALEGIGEYVGVTGTFEVSADNHQGLGEGDLVVLTVQDGTWAIAG